MRAAFLVPLVIGLAACGALPDVPQATNVTAVSNDYPDFVPIQSVVLAKRESEQKNLETEEELEARLAGLRARAARLRTVSVE